MRQHLGSQMKADLPRQVLEFDSLVATEVEVPSQQEV